MVTLMHLNVGDRSDFVVNFNLYNENILPFDYETDNELQRKSRYKKINEHGKYLLNFCKATGMRIINGRLGDDKTSGDFTCINSTGSSVVNMVLCRSDFFQHVSSFLVQEPNILSDHCVVNISHVQYCLASCMLSRLVHYSRH